MMYPGFFLMDNDKRMHTNVAILELCLFILLPPGAYLFFSKWEMGLLTSCREKLQIYPLSILELNQIEQFTI